MKAASDAASGAGATTTVAKPASRAARAEGSPAAITGIARTRARCGPSARAANPRATEPLVARSTSTGPSSRTAASLAREPSGASSVR